MSAEMSSVKSEPSSSAPCFFDPEISFSPTLIDSGRIDEGCYMSPPALVTHLFLFNSLLRTDKTKWVVAWLRSPPTFLFVFSGRSDNLSRLTSLILNIPVRFIHAKWLTNVCEPILNNYSMACRWLEVPRGRSWAADNSLSSRGRWGGGSGSREAGLKASAEGCVLQAGRQAGRQAGGCDEWLAHALEAPDGQAGTHASGVRGPGVTLCICSPCQDSGRAMMFGQPSPLSSPRSWGWNSSWARDESNTTKHLMLCWRAGSQWQSSK